ncbi:MAG: lactonase family protein [Planctomyces sp.]|nr:lactonase family protein [Planctomyces sp.]
MIKRTALRFGAALFLLIQLATSGFGESFVYVSLLEEQKIVRFQRNTETGELTRCGETQCSAEPASLTASRNGLFLYVSMRSSGQLAAYRIQPSDGSLELLSLIDGGDDPAYLRIDGTGRYLITAYYVSNKVTVHAIEQDGRLSQQPLQSVQTSNNAHGVAIDAANRTVYVSHTGANRIDQFRFDSRTGMLTPLNPPFVAAPAGQNPRHVVLHPSGKSLFCSNEAGGSAEDGVSRYEVDPDSGRLTLKQSLSSLPDSFDATMNSTAECLLTPDGHWLFVANRGHNSLAGFRVDPGGNELARVSVTATEAVPRSFTITNDGKWLYSAGEQTGQIAAYRILADGALEPFQKIPAGPISWCILAVDPETPSR